MGPIDLQKSDVSKFAEDGVVCLRGVFDRQWLKQASLGIEKNMQNPSELSITVNSSEDGSCQPNFFQDLANWQRIPELETLAKHSPAPELAGKLMQSKYAVFYHDHVLNKQPGSQSLTPWHQDQPYYHIDGDKNCSIWIPVDPVSEDTSICFVAGSHRWHPNHFHPKLFTDNSNYEHDRGEVGGHVWSDMPDIDAGNHKILKWKMEPGDCVVFHMKLIHGAPANNTTMQRRVVSLRYLGDDCVFAERPWSRPSRVTLPEGEGLGYGHSVACNTYPIVWRK